MNDLLIEDITKKHLVFHDGVKLVSGIINSILIDTDTEKYYTLNQETYNLLFGCTLKYIDEVIEHLNKKDKDLFLKYLSVLISNSFCFITCDISSFPSYSLNYNKTEIEHVIIEYNFVNDLHYNNLVLEAVDLGCTCILIDVVDKIPKLIRLCDHIYCILRLSFRFFNDIKKNLVSNINEYHIFDSPYDKFISIKGISFIYISSDNYSLNCGIISKYWFSLSLSHINLAINSNTCLNRKISIDADGNIKNCPSMKESFGNIKDTTLAEALEKPGFKKYWNIKKDDITKCKDCEFRYICTDCRAYLEDPDDIYSAPLKCGYDPYTGKWEEWSKNPLKQKAIEYYEMEDLVKNEEE